MITTKLRRSVRLAARASALLFAAAQAAPALGSHIGRASRPLYLGFVAAHATHFTLVARYAHVTGGRDLFPGGRSMNEVGGWPTVLAIDTVFAGLAVTGWAGMSQRTRPPWHRAAGCAATGLIGALFVGTFLGQLARSPWYALPATVVSAAVMANGLTGRRTPESRP